MFETYDYTEPLWSDIKSYGDVVIYKYRVMYGYRIRIAYIEKLNTFCEIDICCGNDEKAYVSLREILEHIIINNPIDEPLKDIPPHTKIKPYFKDMEFCKYIYHLYKKLKHGLN